MNYLVIGAGGTGGAIGGYLSRAGKEVTLIARGAHLEAMQKKGLHFETPDGAFTVPVNACTAEEYHETPDVVFVCVKGYSLEGIVPFLNRQFTLSNLSSYLYTAFLCASVAIFQCSFLLIFYIISFLCLISQAFSFSSLLCIV